MTGATQRALMHSLHDGASDPTGPASHPAYTGGGGDDARARAHGASGGQEHRPGGLGLRAARASAAERSHPADDSIYATENENENENGGSL